MQIVIDISEEMYDWLDNGFPTEDDYVKLWEKIRQGTILPKGHGNLYDERDLKKLGNVYFQEEVITNDSNLEYRFPKLIINATPIIEADRIESEGCDMSNIELVIKIPEEKFSIIKNKMYCGVYDAGLYKAIANGTPLLKGHGDLKDTQDIINKLNLNYNNHQTISAQSIKDIIQTIPTIIEADKGE